MGTNNIDLGSDVCLFLSMPSCNVPPVARVPSPPVEKLKMCSAFCLLLFHLYFRIRVELFFFFVFIHVGLVSSGNHPDADRAYF